jgi:hypothetical protein
VPNDAKAAKFGGFEYEILLELTVLKSSKLHLEGIEPTTPHTKGRKQNHCAIVAMSPVRSLLGSFPIHSSCVILGGIP